MYSMSRGGSQGINKVKCCVDIVNDVCVCVCVCVHVYLGGNVNYTQTALDILCSCVSIDP